MHIINDYISGLNTAAQIIISVASMLFAGFIMTRITKRLHLPNVTAYIVAGIIIGPYCLGIIPASVADGMDFIADIALAFIAFGTGEFFRISTLKQSGAKNIVITVFEAVIAAVAVFILTYFILNLGIVFSIVLSSLAMATAPASTVMTIKQTGAKGDFVDTLLQVVALDDVVGLIGFGVSVSVATAALYGTFHITSVLKPIAVNTAVFLLGGVFGLLLKFLLPKKRSNDNRLIIAIAVLFAFCGICALIDVSPLLGCMAIGTVYINTTDDDKLFKQINYFAPPVLLLFFVRSGVCFRLDALTDTAVSVAGVPLIVIGVGYFIVRIIGKYGGAYLGCLAVKKSSKVRNNLGLALIPQAGVAIGLAVLATRSIGGTVGEALETIILASSVLYELIGPACAKLALYLSGSYNNEAASETVNTAASESEEESLEEKIRKIRADLPPTYHSEEEAAFTEAAEEQYYYMNTRRRNH